MLLQCYEAQSAFLKSTDIVTLQNFTQHPALIHLADVWCPKSRDILISISVRGTQAVLVLLTVKKEIT
jgi:hypothetical protein